MNNLLLNLAFAAAMCAMSSCNKSDPFGTASFNKTVVAGYALERAATLEKLPVIIETVSDTQRITLHGEALLTAVVAEKVEGLTQQRLLYFVSKATGGAYLSGYSSLIVNIDTNGFDSEVAEVRARMPADVTPTPTP